MKQHETIDKVTSGALIFPKFLNTTQEIRLNI